MNTNRMQQEFFRTEAAIAMHWELSGWQKYVLTGETNGIISPNNRFERRV